MIGNNAIEATVNDWGPAQLVLCRFQASQSETISELNAYLGTAWGSPTRRGVVFSDNNGAPSQLLGEGTDVIIPATQTWVTLPGLNVPITAGAFYWLGIWGDTGAILDTEDQTVATNQLAYLNSVTYIPNSFVPDGYRAYMMSIYAGDGVPPPPNYTLTLTASVGGSITATANGQTLNAGTYSLPADTFVSILATPAIDYVLDNFYISSTNNTVPGPNPFTVVMQADFSIKANFESTVNPPVKYTLTLSASAGGSIIATADGQTLGSGAYRLPENTSASILATPNTGYVLDNFYISSTNSTVTEPNPFIVVLQADFSIKANFKPVAEGGGSILPTLALGAVVFAGAYLLFKQFKK